MNIGVDPHKCSHTATAMDEATNTPVSSVRVDANLGGYRHLLRWASQFGERRWTVENARGLGCHLAQWLVAQYEGVLDASTAATARMRELSQRQLTTPSYAAGHNGPGTPAPQVSYCRDPSHTCNNPD